MMKLSTLVAFVAVLLTGGLLVSKGFGAEASVAFYVSPTGNDNNQGTKAKPFASLTKARDAVRDRTKDGQKTNIVVFLRGGTYELNEPLVLGPQDSGTAKFSITYRAFPGEKPIISGGRRISGWKPGPGRLWQVELPQVKAQKWYFRQLFVDGKRAVRARFPNVDNVAVIKGLSHSAPSYIRINDAKRKDGIWTVAVDYVENWGNLADVELVVLGYWDIMRKRLASVDQDKSEAILAPPHVDGGQHNPESGVWCFFENAFEMLDQPGEWYLDRSKGTLFYLPLQGQDMTKVEVVAPVLTQLLEITGRADRMVRNVHFKGLAFRHARWPLPPWGFAGYQAATMRLPDDAKGNVGQAILWKFTKSCSFTDGEISRVGGSGISLREGCVGNLIEGNHIYNIGANGVNVGQSLLFKLYDSRGDYRPAEVDVPRHNRITNNYIHGCGTDYYGSVGIFIAFTDGTIVAHNLLHDLPYTGISVGLMWGGAPTVCRNNVIEYNHIYDVMKTMHDGGGIYTLGLQPGTIIRGNLIHDVRRSLFARGGPSVGLYFDSSSSQMLVEGNTVYELALPGWPCWPVFIGKASNDIMFRRNVFVIPDQGTVFGYYQSKKSDSQFEDNTVISPENWKPPANLKSQVGLEPAYRKALLGQSRFKRLH